MMVELILVEGVSDVQLISYYLQNVYGWKYFFHPKKKHNEHNYYYSLCHNMLPPC